MTVAEAKDIFGKIATKVVAHDLSVERSQFFMADSDDFKAVSENFLNLRRMCMDVSYPISEIQVNEKGTLYINTIFIVTFSRIVEKEDFNDQSAAIDEALIAGINCTKYLYWLQRKNKGFSVVKTSQSSFNGNRTEIKTLIDNSADFTCGRQFYLNFESPFNYCDPTIEADVKTDPLWN